MSRGCREIPRKLTNCYAQRHAGICKELLTNRRDSRYDCQIVIGDGKWIYFRISNTRNQCYCFDRTSEPIVKQGQFEERGRLNVERLLHLSLLQGVTHNV